jgi:hypothetical protein
MYPLLFWLEIGTHVDPVCGLVDSLHTLIQTSIVKNHIISAIPICPNHSTNSHSNQCFRFLINSIKPIAKQILYICWWGHIKSKVNYPPNDFCERAWNEGALRIPLSHKKHIFLHPSSPVLSSYLLWVILFMKEPHEYPNLQGKL